MNYKIESKMEGREMTDFQSNDIERLGTQDKWPVQKFEMKYTPGRKAKYLLWQKEYYNVGLQA